METIKAIYEKGYFKPLTPFPAEGRYEVTIIFTKHTDSKAEKQKRILNLFGKWDEEDAKEIKKIIQDRKNFATNRIDI